MILKNIENGKCFTTIMDDLASRAARRAAFLRSKPPIRKADRRKIEAR
jgi:hypothetical protein